jgi:membrane-associated phospholipid phosphatase
MKPSNQGPARTRGRRRVRSGAQLTAVTLGWLALAAPASGQPNDLRYDVRIDVPVAVAATAGWVTSELLKSHLAHRDCVWCDRNSDGGDDLNGVDASVRSALQWSNIDAGDMASNVTGFVVVPLGVLGLTALAAAHEDRLSNFPVDLLLIAEATALAVDLNQLVKFAVGRERPFVHALPAEAKAHTAHPSDNNTSFYSGHTNLVFALAVSGGTVASMRGYRWAPWIWGVGLAVAATTGYLRIAGDRHYFTDVLTGAVVGSAIGFAVPYLLHRPRERANVNLVAAPSLGRPVLGASFGW